MPAAEESLVDEEAVIVRATDERVDAARTVEAVIARPTIERVIVAAARERIVARPARERVGIRVARNRVVVGGANNVLDIDDPVLIGRDKAGDADRGRAIQGDRDAVETVGRTRGDDIGIIRRIGIGATIERVIARAARERVVARAPGNRIGAIIARKTVVCCRAENILDIADIIDPASGVPHGSRQEIDGQVASAAPQTERVIAGPAVQGLAAAIGEKRIVARAARGGTGSGEMEVIISGAAIERGVAPSVDRIVPGHSGR